VGERLTSQKFKLRSILRNNYVQTGILVVIVLVSGFGFFYGLQTALRTEYPLFAVASGSMEPTLFRGDLIVVQGGLDFSELTVGYVTASVPGEIIVYRVPSEYRYMSSDPIVHRAVAKEYRNNRWYFYTKGDANSQIDYWSPINQDYIIGRVVGKVPWLGNLSLLMREHPFEGFLLIAILIVVAIFVDFGFPRKKKKPEVMTEALI
jgi:signal peptidase